MKAYKKLAIQVLQLEEDVIADSGVVSTAEDLNGFDDVFQFGA